MIVRTSQIVGLTDHEYNATLEFIKSFHRSSVILYSCLIFIDTIKDVDSKAFNFTQTGETDISL
jgi:hypothetical protein